MTDDRKQIKITKRVVDSLRADGTDYYVFDTEVVGFGIRVRKTGGMSYIVRYRAGTGRDAPVRRVTIAKLGKVTPEQAREAAKGTLASVVKGADPAKEKAADRKALTFAEFSEKFLKHIEAKRKPTTATHYRQLLELHAKPTLGNRKAAAVSVEDIATLHLKLSEKPAAANRVRAIISSMYSWGIKGKLLPKMDNPAASIDRYPERRRERFLKTEEIGRLASALQEAETTGVPWEPDPEKKTKHAKKPENRLVKIEAPVAAAIRLLLLTGARLREILHLKWEHVDFERGLLLLPDSKTGRKTIVLNAPALSVLNSVPRLGAYVVAGESAGTDDEKPRADLKRPWAMLVRRAKLEGLRLHDLRHSFASFGAGGGLGLPIIGKLLGHVQPATTQRYAHLDADPLRKASDAIGSAIAAAMGETKNPAEVIPIRKGKTG